MASAGTHAWTPGGRGIDAYKCARPRGRARYGRNGDLPTAEGVRPITEWQVRNEQLLDVRGRGTRRRPAPVRAPVEVTTAAPQRRPRPEVVLAGMPTTQRPRRDELLGGVDRKRRIERSSTRWRLLFARNHRGFKAPCSGFATCPPRERPRPVHLGGRGRWSTQAICSTSSSRGCEGQAEQLKKTFELLRGGRRSWNLGTVNWPRWREERHLRGPRDLRLRRLSRRDGSRSPHAPAREHRRR